MKSSDSAPPALQGWLGRHSQGIRHLSEPGPCDTDLTWMARAALSAPDHAGLAPFRFKVLRGTDRFEPGRLFARVARAAGKDEASVTLEFERAERAPVTVAVLARLDLDHPGQADCRHDPGGARAKLLLP